MNPFGFIGPSRLIFVVMLAVASACNLVLANDIDPFQQFGCASGMMNCERPYLSMADAQMLEKASISDFDAIEQIYIKGWLALLVGEYELAGRYLNGALLHAEEKCDQHDGRRCVRLRWLIIIHLAELNRDTKHYNDAHQFLNKANDIYKDDDLHSFDFEDVALMSLLAGDLSMLNGEYESALDDYIRTQQAISSRRQGERPASFEYSAGAADWVNSDELVMRLASVYGKLGKTDLGLKIIEPIAVRVEKASERSILTADALNVGGELQLAAGAVAQAERWMVQSIADREHVFGDHCSVPAREAEKLALSLERLATIRVALKNPVGADEVRVRAAAIRSHLTSAPYIDDPARCLPR
ncbi:MAG: hypothetical protein JO002_00440 [Burkholderiaceae bacterium]|nr:hypothetical protein [Burkholderiaceae bacterium]